MLESESGNNSERLLATLGIELDLPTANAKRAWDFLNWVVPGGAFSLLFIKQMDDSSQFHVKFAVDAFDDFNDHVRARL